MKKAIIGAGGLGRELYYQMLDNNKLESIELFDDNTDLNFRTISEIDTTKYEVIVAISNPIIRKRIVKKLYKNTKFFTFIHKSAIILDKNVRIGDGSIICAGVIITTNVTIGKHAQLNPRTTISHDCIIGDYFTATPNVNVSGNCSIGDNVYVGTNSAIKDKIKITNNVILGLNSGVVHNITESGTYIGCPTKRIK